MPAELTECLERLAHYYPRREQLGEALRSLLAEAEASQVPQEGMCDLCGYQIDAHRLEERCFCSHPFVDQ